MGGGYPKQKNLLYKRLKGPIDMANNWKRIIKF